jgi:hypothetical protein
MCLLFWVSGLFLECGFVRTETVLLFFFIEREEWGVGPVGVWASSEKKNFCCMKRMYL